MTGHGGSPGGRGGVGRRVGLGIAAVVLLVSACSSGPVRGTAGSEADGEPVALGDTDATAPSDSAGRSGPTDADGNGAGQGEGDGDGDGEEPLSPLGAYLGYPIPGFDGADDQELRRIYVDALAACMRDEGFAYVAWVAEPGAVVVPVEEGLDPESREFAARYGFGISTQFFAQGDVGPGLIGYTGPHDRLDLDADPNHAIREALTAEELEAYQRAYFGADSPFFDPDGYDEEAEGVPYGWAISTYGCVGQAERAVSGDAFELMGRFAAEVLSMSTEATADERYVRHLASVERCVREAGYDFYVADPAWAVLAHFDDLVAEVDEMAGGNPLAGLTEEQMGAMGPEQIEALNAAPRFLGPEAKARLAEVQDLETSTAAAVWDCGGNAGENRRVLDEVVADLQGAFIEANRDDLDSFRR